MLADTKLRKTITRALDLHGGRREKGETIANTCTKLRKTPNTCIEFAEGGIDAIANVCNVAKNAITPKINAWKCTNTTASTCNAWKCESERNVHISIFYVTGYTSILVYVTIDFSGHISILVYVTI